MFGWCGRARSELAELALVATLFEPKLLVARQDLGALRRLRERLESGDALAGWVVAKRRQERTGMDLFLVVLGLVVQLEGCLLYTSPSPRDATLSRMPSSA